MQLYKASHTVYKTQYHIVWVTRFRRKILVEGEAKYLRVEIEEVRKHYPDWQFSEIGIDKDHVHVHMVIPLGIWSTGYFVSTVGIMEEIIRRYVARQGKEDAGQEQLEF